MMLFVICVRLLQPHTRDHPPVNPEVCTMRQPLFSDSASLSFGWKNALAYFVCCKGCRLYYPMYSSTSYITSTSEDVQLFNSAANLWCWTITDSRSRALWFKIIQASNASSSIIRWVEFFCAFWSSFTQSSFQWNFQTNISFRPLRTSKQLRRRSLPELRH